MEEKIKELEKQIAELKRETEIRLNKGDDYYYIREGGEVGRYEEDNDSVDDDLYDFGNYFKLEEEAEKIAKKLKAATKVTRAINKANNGWEPDWNRPYQDKIQITFNSDEMKIVCVDFGHYQQALLIPYIEDFTIAEKIIKEYEKELKIIFDIEE